MRTEARADFINPERPATGATAKTLVDQVREGLAKRQRQSAFVILPAGREVFQALPEPGNGIAAEFSNGP